MLVVVGIRRIGELWGAHNFLRRCCLCAVCHLRLHLRNLNSNFKFGSRKCQSSGGVSPAGDGAAGATAGTWKTCTKDMGARQSK